MNCIFGHKWEYTTERKLIPPPPPPFIPMTNILEKLKNIHFDIETRICQKCHFKQEIYNKNGNNTYKNVPLNKENLREIKLREILKEELKK